MLLISTFPYRTKAWPFWRHFTRPKQYLPLCEILLVKNIYTPSHCFFYNFSSDISRISRKNITATQSGKTLKSPSGGVSLLNRYSIYSQEYTPPHCFFYNFSSDISHISCKNITATQSGKKLKSPSGGVSLLNRYSIYSQEYTPPHCFFMQFFQRYF